MRRRSIPGRRVTDSRVHSAYYEMDIEASTLGEYNDQGADLTTHLHLVRARLGVSGPKLAFPHSLL
jgi:hypothetical protein